MKNFFMILMIASFFSGLAFAEEVKTDCPWMKEETTRSNPKANTETPDIRSAPQNPSTTKQ